MSTANVTILGTGSYLPDTVSTNAALAARLGIDPDWIVAKTGILERRVADPDEATSNLATRAAERALDAAGVAPEQLDLIVVATSTPDEVLPATACRVQANLRAYQAPAFDIDAVCAGFLYGLATLDGMLRSDPERRFALLVGADTYSRILDYDDRRTAVLFGDGAGAVVLGKTDRSSGILATSLRADGDLADLVRVPAGGSRLPASAETVASGQHYFLMEGQEVRTYVERMFPEVIEQTLKQAGLTLDDIDLIVPHQANGVLLRQCARMLELDVDRMHLTVERYGNTGAASVPITLDDAVRVGAVHPGDALLLVAFGGGMTTGGTAVRWEMQ